jgi:hypothetical protein
LVCPLDWGLGHATRCVPLIYQFLQEGHNVIIGADKSPLAFLQQEFPQLKTIVIPGYDIEYSEKGNALKLFYEGVKFYTFIKKEKQFIDEILAENPIDMIVSDNRYGLYSKKVESVIITHQLYPKAPIGEKLLHQKIEKLLANFNTVWIPDYKGDNNLSGDLAHLKSFNHPHKFIGPLSRFSLLQLTSSCHTEPVEVSRNKQDFEFDICAIISGPEPQRTIFEQLIFAQIEKHDLKAVVVRGLPNVDGRQELEDRSFYELQTPNSKLQTKTFNHLETTELYHYITKSKWVVSRSGYSSIMDLVALNKKAILVPTPGQTEQEYLAAYHSKKGLFTVQEQETLNLNC